MAGSWGDVPEWTRCRGQLEVKESCRHKLKLGELIRYGGNDSLV